MHPPKKTTTLPSKNQLVSLMAGLCSTTEYEKKRLFQLFEETEKKSTFLNSVRYWVSKCKAKWVNIDSKKSITLMDQNIDGIFAVLFRYSDEVIIGRWRGHNAIVPGWEMISADKKETGIKWIMLLIPGHL